MHNIKYILIALLSSAMLSAQTVSGTVSDTDGSGLAGANVSVDGTDLGSASNNDGSYSVTGLSAGTYTVTASYIGYESTSSSVTVGDGQTVTLNLTLTQGDVRLNQVVVAASRKKELVVDAPASVEVFSSEELSVRSAKSIIDHTEGRAGVETMKTGMQSSNVTLRGFNGIFSGALHVMVDNRWARPPVITANIYQLIGIEDDDIDRIELVRGPGSTMYGPNTAQGVMAIYTKSPFDQSGTRVELHGGMNNYSKLSVRNAGQWGSKFAYRVSLSHTEYDEWSYDINNSGGVGGYSEPATVRRWLAIPSYPFQNFDTVYDDPVGGVDNNPATENSPVNLYSDIFSTKMEFRPDLKSTITLSLRSTESDVIEMTGIGRAYGIGANSMSEQLSYQRQDVLGGDLYINLFRNHNKQDGTYILATGQIIYDRSESVAFQIQHSVPLGNGQSLTYGIDHEDRSPDTGYSINGVFEDDDDYTSDGVYAQYENRINDKWKVVAAIRGDDNTWNDDLLVAPRFAVVHNPTATGQIRFTYNKAFEVPGNYPKNLDITQYANFLSLAGVPDFSGLLGFQPDFNLRAMGARNGYNYHKGTNGVNSFRSNWSQHPYLGGNINHNWDLGDNNFNAVVWPTLASFIGGGFLQGASGQALLAGYAQGVAAAYAAATGDVSGAAAYGAAAAGAAAADFQTLMGVTPNIAHVTAKFNPAAGAFIPSDGANAMNVAKNDHTTRDVWEIGYKGQVGNGMVLGVDVWTTEVHDYIGALTNMSHSVIMAADGADYVAKLMTAMYGNANLTGFVNLLDSAAAGGNGNGIGADDLAAIVAGQVGMIPVGNVSPDHSPYGADMIFGYGKVTESFRLSGMDLSLNWYPSEDWSFWSAMSYINKDEISVPNVDEEGILNMNTPKMKLGGGLQYSGDGHGYGLRLRYQDSYNMDGSVYAGKVESFYTLGVNASFDIDSAPGLKVTLTVDNITDQVHREAFQGALMGRWASVRLGYEF
jgi:outer membrane receptor protein involved in Fe transport